MTPASWFYLYSGLAFGTAIGLMLYALFSRSQQADENRRQAEHNHDRIVRSLRPPDLYLTTNKPEADTHLEMYICHHWRIANIIGTPKAWGRTIERLGNASRYCFHVGYIDHAAILRYAADLASFRLKIECSTWEPE